MSNEEFDFDSKSTVKNNKFSSIFSKLEEIEMETEKLGLMEDEMNEANMLDNVENVTEEKIEPSAEDIDSRSVYVGNVDYSTTVQELEQHFNSCGKVNRITIQCNKVTKKPKGFAYIEFESAESAEASVALTDTLFKGRLLKVLPKRTNVPGISGGDRAGAPGRFRGRYRRGGTYGRYRGSGKRSRY